jgi:parallel beta-helix repeat protein
MYDGIGILGIGSRGNVVQGNTVSRSNAQEEIVGAGIGIVLTPFLDEGLPREQSIFDNQILDNIVRDNDNSGISNISNVNGLIRGNLVQGNGRLTDAVPANGIGVQNLRSAPADTHVTVEGNTVLGNGSVDVDGVPFSGDGINVTSKQNRIVNNRIESSQFDGVSLVGSENELSRNRIEGNGRDGVIVTSHDNDVSGNRVHRNTASGIKAEAGSSGNRLRSNDAADNGEPIADFESFTFQADLIDVNADFDEDSFVLSFGCGTNTWTANTWGSGGFFPDPALSDPDAGILIADACTATGGKQTGGKPRPAATRTSRIAPADPARPADPHNPVVAPEPVCQPTRRCSGGR